jgi:ATP-dependent DNA ligase
MVTRALAERTGVPVDEVRATLRETGDLGLTVEQLLASHGAADRPSTLEVGVVFETLHQIAAAAGPGSQGRKLERLAPLARPGPPARVDARMVPDVWFEPAVVVEVLGAELTLSPTHTAAEGVLKEDAGLALRFPRFTGRWRDDKSAEDATTVQEILDLYHAARPTPTGS